MSKVIYWSPFHGQGQTSNLHATAFIMGLLYRKKVLLMQTHFCQNNLESPLVGRNVGLHNNSDYELFDGVGLDLAVTYSIMKELKKDLLQKCCFTLPGTPILLLPGTVVKNKETFDRDISSNVARVINDADRCVDLVLIDVNSGEDKLSQQLISLADLIVVNLTQHRHVLDKFFTDYGDRFLDHDKVFYLFGDYDDNSSYNIYNCRRKYSRLINSKNSGVIPYCTQFMDAQNESKVISFMKKGLRKRKESPIELIISIVKKIFSSGYYYKDETDYFFYRTKQSVEKMFHMLNIPMKSNSKEGGIDADK